MKTENRGGVRTSLTKKIGRPTKEPTRVLNFRVPVKDYERLKPLVGEYLEGLLKCKYFYYSPKAMRWLPTSKNNIV